MKLILQLIVMITLFGGSTLGVSGGEMCGNEIACAARSVVSVVPKWPPNFSRKEEPEGSGIVVAEGNLIATADHVLGPARQIFVRDFDGNIEEAQIVLRDGLSDVALLRINSKLPAVEYASKPQLAQKTCAIGNSFGLGISITCGVVSAVGKSGVGFNAIEDFIQSDAAVNPGMSGGALVDESGKLLGMLSAIFTKDADANIGVNFSVSSALLKRIVDDFLDDGKLQRLLSGVALVPARITAKYHGKGVEVRQVRPGSVEAVAGVETGDIITKIEGQTIRHPAKYNATLAMIKPGAAFEINIVRNSKPLTLIINFR